MLGSNLDSHETIDYLSWIADHPDRANLAAVLGLLAMPFLFGMRPFPPLRRLWRRALGREDAGRRHERDRAPPRCWDSPRRPARRLCPEQRHTAPLLHSRRVVRSALARRIAQDGGVAEMTNTDRKSVV